MAPLIGAALIGGGASLLGGMMGSSGAKKANAAMERQAQRSMEFEQWMSSTAHRREVDDLRAAGLNPILSGTGGMGASTAKGAMAAQVNEMQPLENAANAGAASATQWMRTSEEVKNMREARFNTQQDSALKQAQTEKANSEINLLRESVREAKASADIREADAVGREVEADIDKSTWGRVMRYINRANPLGSTGSSAIRAIKQ